MRTPPTLPDMPPIPQDEEGPVFREPWEAQAFAMTLKLYDEGHFTWREWVDALSAEIKAAKDSGAADDGSTYYHFWLSALEKLSAAKGLTSSEELGEKKEAWAAADEHRDFGAPVALGDGGHHHHHH